MKMLKRPLNYLLRSNSGGLAQLRNFHHEFSNPEERKDNKASKDSKIKISQPQASPGIMQQRYKVFRDEESIEIFDVEEERQRLKFDAEEDKELDALDDMYYGLNLKRGVNGVFDIEDLVSVLRKENTEDVFVCSVPKDLRYVDHMVICSGRSYRHMLAIANFVRRIYKIKRARNDILPKIEGENSREWMALDLGNIALHIFSPEAREQYDLESLWAIGPEYDRESNKKQDPLVQLFESHTFLIDREPKT